MNNLLKALAKIQVLSQTIDITDKVILARDAYHNCRTFIQTVTGINELEALPQIQKPKPGSILWFGLLPTKKDKKSHYKHVALYLNEREALEVEEWGGKPRLVSLKDLYSHYTKPDRILDTGKVYTVSDKIKTTANLLTSKMVLKAITKVVEGSARVDRLMEMFQLLPAKDSIKSEIPTKSKMERIIKDLIQEWRRADVLVWGLRKYRDMYKDQLKQEKDQEGTKDGRYIYKNTPAILEGLELKKQRLDLEHYLSNARVNEYRSILDFRFPPNASVTEVMDTLRGLETKEKEATNEDSRYLSEEDRSLNIASTLIKFPDGWVWDLLSTGFCEREGKAMHHCGNANHVDGDEILSLREPVKVGKEKMWKPHATFILNNGVLGEMKGFANEKPGKKLHPYIVKLLENDMVDFIKGGGYAPQNNFAINDLDQGYLKELQEKKLSVTMGLKEYFTKYKDTEKIAKYLKTLGVQKVQGNTAYLEQYDNIRQFAKSYNRDSLTDALDNIDDPVDLVDIRTEDRDRETLLNEVETKHSDKFKKLVSLLPKYYEADFKQFAEQIDKNLDEDVITDLKDDPVPMLDEMMQDGLLDDLASSLNSAYLDGWQRGSEAAMHNELTSYLKNVEAGIFSLYFETDYVFDSPVWIVATVSDVLDVMEDYDSVGDMVDREFDLGNMRLRYETEYDEDYAVEQFFEMIHSNMPKELLRELT